MIVASSARDGNPAHVLRVAHLAKHYDHEAAIADVTFSVIPGEVLGIVGPNGAGKTTLLETLVGLLAASSGTVFWRGRELPVPRRKEALFYLPDGVKPYQDRFAAEVVSFFASVYRRSDREVAARIDSVGLAPALGKRVHALSKGYTRRLLLALGLLTPQDMLLMDEPFDGFDLRQTRSIIEPRKAAPSFSPFTNWPTPSGFATDSFFSQEGRCGGLARSTNCACKPDFRLDLWRRFFLRSPKAYELSPAPLYPLLAKELAEIVSGRALWTMLLLVCSLVGYSFVQAVSLYSEASAAALQSPVLATSLSPLDGILVPTFGSFYVAVTLLFPFVALRVLGQEKETGALRLLVQLPYRSFTLVSLKLVAVLAAWALVSIPALSALAIWAVLGGHLAPSETLNLLFGHLLYGLLVGAIALFAATISESSATAAIIALAVTIGSWVMDFTLAGRSGLLAWVAQLSLTQTLRTFEQGLLSAGLVLGITAVVCGLAALASVWLPPGTPLRAKFIRSVPCVIATVAALAIATQIRKSVDVTEDRRNSFPPADQRLLATLRLPLVVTVHLAPEDPRYVDLQRNVLARLERAMPKVSVVLAVGARAGRGLSRLSVGRERGPDIALVPRRAAAARRARVVVEPSSALYPRLFY